MDPQTATFRLIDTRREISSLERQIARLNSKRAVLVRDAEDYEAILQRRNIPVTVLPMNGDGGI